MVDFNSVLNDARQLTPEDQFRLFEALWTPGEDTLSNAWKAELDRRIARMDSRESQGVPWEEVRLKARQRAGFSDVD
jgi:putative addiction module component (TIGR02574 family)